MADLRRRSKSVLRWALTALILLYAVSDWGDQETAAPTAEPAEDGAVSAIRITSISNADVNPGDALVVKVEGVDDTEPITAKIAKLPATVIVHEPGSLVIRVPSDAPLGKASMRVSQGMKRSKSWDLHIRATNHRKLIARLIGGLALFVLGLGMLATGMRGLTGQRVRSLLSQLTRSPAKATAVGVLVGAVTQLTTSAAALTVSLVEARLLALGSAVAILAGAQLGASVTGALLPVALARESLLVIAIGVLWTRLSTGRRAHAVANLVLGTGLMLYGVHLLQTSVEPLVSDPKLLPYLVQLRGDNALALLACALTGAVLALALQGPGPVYVLVVGLVHASGALPLTNAIAILAGSGFGAAVAMSAIAWQSGEATRALAGPHLLFGLTATLIGIIGLPLWTWIPSRIASTAAMPLQLAIGFGIAQLVATLGWLLVLPALTARVTQRRSSDRTPAASTPDALVLTAHRELAGGLARLRETTEIAFETACAGERARAADSEEALTEARRMIERQYALLGDTSASGELERASASAVASLQLQRVVEQLAHLADLGVERGLRLTPVEQARLQAMHTIALESFDAAIEVLERGGLLDSEAAGAREIRMNQLEAEGRSTATSAPRTGDSASIRLGISELIDAYEHVGNHLFRIAKTLATDGDDLA